MESIAYSLKRAFVEMVLGRTSDVEGDLRLFTQSELRNGKNLTRSVHKNGVSRCPELNQFTGSVAMYMNSNLLELATRPEVLETFTKAYDVDPKELGLCHGPPTLLIKPEGSGVSQPFVYTFQDISDGEKWTGIMSLTSHSKQQNSGGLQKLSNFELYYELLNQLFNFGRHCSEKDVIHLDKWFSIETANDLIEEYTIYDAFKSRNVPIQLNRPISDEVIQIWESSSRIKVLEVFQPLTWVDVPMQAGDLKLFSSKEAIRTLSCSDVVARVYVQFAIEVKPADWNSSQKRNDLEFSYRSGKFGEWDKPGKRLYIRDNKTEHKSLTKQKVEDVLKVVLENRSIFAI